MLYNNALKASFKLYKEVKSLDLPVNTLLHMFDHMVKPIALYGCEIWGILTVGKQGKNKDLYDLYKDFEVENLNIQFCKFLLGLNKKSTNIAVLSELGRLPMFCLIIIAVFSFWHRLEKMPETSLLYCAYTESVNLCNINVNSWYKTVVFLSEKIGTNISLSRYKNLSLSCLSLSSI